jgi:prophage antirepressor-like protein
MRNHYRTNPIMDDVVEFTNTRFNVTLEVLKDDSGEVWFPAKEVAEALGYARTANAIFRHVDREDKNTLSRIQGLDVEDPPQRGPRRGDPFLGGSQPGKIYINETGFYDLVSRSQLDSAKEFRRWVHNEVFPSIRKTGGYTLTPQEPSDELVELTSWIKKTFPGTMIIVSPKFAVDTREKLEICESIGWEVGQPDVLVQAPSGANTALAIFCYTGIIDKNTARWMDYHERCSNKVLELTGDMDRVKDEIDHYFQKVIRKCYRCDRRFKNCGTLVNHMAAEQQGWGHERGVEDVLYDFVHCGRCKVCVDAANKNKCFICMDYCLSNTFQTREDMIEHLQVRHGIDMNIILKCIREISTPKTKVVL